jgi:hypothetical protein
MDYSIYELSNINYGGSERKIGIFINGVPYMIKFQKKTAFGKRNNHISEYLGSSIFRLLGLNCQMVFLGTFKDENVVVCKDFNIDGYQFVPFNDVGESTIEEDKEKYQYSYEDIMSLLLLNKKITNVEDVVSSFWEIYIIDALLGNFDRHGNNWGFLKKNNKYEMAPVFDNGSCLFPNMINEDEMLYIMNSKEETDKRVYSFPASQIKLNGKKSSYYDVINSLVYKECNEALIKIFKRINLKEIFNLIDDIKSISEVHKSFYKYMLNERYEKIIKESYNKLEKVMGNEK